MMCEDRSNTQCVAGDAHLRQCEATVAVREILREARRANGLTQRQLAVRLYGRYSNVQLSRWERGERVPRADTFLVLASELGILGDLLILRCK